jgi:hypothetical protein
MFQMILLLCSSALEMKGADSSKMLVLISQGTMHHIPGDSNLYGHLHENLKSDGLNAHYSGL